MMYKTYEQTFQENKNLLGLIKNKRIIDNDERIKFISNLLKDKKIINIGCLNHTLQLFNGQHNEIKELGKEVIGVDIIKEAEKIGEGIEIGDIQEKEFVNKLLEKYGKFDIVFAGELIEHLDNYISFAKSCKNLINNNGLFIVTTPNPQGLHYFLSNFRHGFLAQGNSEHKFWIDIIQLSENLKNDYELVDFTWINPKGKFIDKVIKLFRKPQLSLNYMAIFKKK